VIPFEKIVKTSEFEGLSQKMDAVLEITTFENTENGKTKVTIHTICTSAQFRDGMISNGMEQALETGHKQLDKLLESLKK
jgi:RNase adaptor protein for sRNA GlmZ degradation